MARVVHFEIHADDVGRARAFYESLFGWQFREVMPGVYWLVTTGPDSEPGINGGLHRREVPLKGEGLRAFVCTVMVDDIDAAIKRATKLGASISIDKEAIPKVGWSAYLKDTEGNLFGVHQPDAKAA
jgi:predicted enzyme related to lactoylglutathione lyase